MEKLFEDERMNVAAEDARIHIEGILPDLCGGFEADLEESRDSIEDFTGDYLFDHLKSWSAEDRQKLKKGIADYFCGKTPEPDCKFPVDALRRRGAL